MEITDAALVFIYSAICISTTLSVVVGLGGIAYYYVRWQMRHVIDEFFAE